MKATTTLISTLAVLAAAGTANAALFVWDWSPGDPGSYGLNNNGGTFESIHATFDDATEIMTWDIAFSDQVTQGYTLAISAGPNPKGHAGELALFYFDASNMSSPLLTAYAYNGKNSQTSYKDGDGNVTGDQTPDLIMDVSRSSWIHAISAQDVGSKRILSFTIDASEINGHTPMYPDATDPWFGAGFAQQIGLWLHPFRSFDPEYTRSGGILSLNASSQGWLDGHSFTTTPTPGSITLLGIAGLVATRRRRS